MYYTGHCPSQNGGVLKQLKPQREIVTLCSLPGLHTAHTICPGCTAVQHSLPSSQFLEGGGALHKVQFLRDKGRELYYIRDFVQRG